MFKFTEFLKFMDTRSKIIISIHFLCIIIIVIGAFLEIHTYVFVLQLPTLFYQGYMDVFYKQTMHEVSLDLEVWFENEKEIDEWIKNNIKLSVVAFKQMGTRYYFLRKTDAMGFKLKWV